MTDDDIRYVLSTFAAGAPDLDPRAGLAERLARRDRARRTAVASVACLAAAIAGTGVAVLTSERGRTGLVVAGDLPSETPSEEPSETPSPTPSETPSATPSASPTASPSVAPTSPAVATKNPPPPTRTSDTGRGEEGLRAQAVLDPASFATATYAALRVTATDDDGFPQITELAWGDGTTEPIAVVAASCPVPEDPPPTSRPKQPGDLDETFRHAWRHPGRYTVTVTVSSSTHCTQPPAKYETATVRVVVDVTAGEVTANGPAKPAFDGSVGYLEGGEMYEWELRGSVTDRDGYFSSATIDWGDGSEPTTITNDQPCDDGEGGHYPARGMLVLDSTHQYQPGQYTVTVTFASTGCAGDDAQPGTATLRADVESID
ncbi:MAG TPA: hypothetical protein VNA20_09235 [Frankiaceae bacterium]|nr:hypothetical protein [Frankiaceae bacterium]